MTMKALDHKGRWRNLTVAFRLSPEENEAINQMVRLSGLTKQDYIARRLQQKDVIVYGNPRVYKALKCEMKQVAEELQRLSNAGEISEELHETIRIVVKIFNGMKEDGVHNEK